MRKTDQQWKSMAGMLTALLVASAEAWAQEHSGGTGRRRIVVSIPDRQLAIVEDGRVEKVYQVAVGAPASPSPAGTFEVVTRIPNPTWYQPGKIVPPGKANPLGTRWLGLSLKGFGIHGTNNPKSIGKSVSHGCIRMRNSDVEQLFSLIHVGDVVELHGEEDAQTVQTFHPAAVTVAFGGGQ